MKHFCCTPALRMALLMLAMLLLAACARRPLLEALDERQANEVMALLLRHNIAAEKHNAGKAGFTVQVAAADLAESIELMQRYDLPSAARSQVAAAFPSDALVSTPLGERARLISAVEQRLEESLSVLDGVHSARVHLNYDANLGGEGRRPDGRRMHVAAVLVHAPAINEQALLQQTKRFLRNTFHDLDYDNVSVVLTPLSIPRTLATTRAEPTMAPLTAWVVGAVAMALLVLLAVLAMLARSVPAVGRWVKRCQQRLRRGTRRVA